MGPIKCVYFFCNFHFSFIFFPRIPFFHILIYRNSVSPFYTNFTIRECEHHSVFLVFQVSFRVQAASAHIYSFTINMLTEVFNTQCHPTRRNRLEAAQLCILFKFPCQRVLRQAVREVEGQDCLGSNVRVVPPQECSPQTKTFLFLPKSQFQFQDIYCSTTDFVFIGYHIKP